jgi:hypothetical protein
MRNIDTPASPSIKKGKNWCFSVSFNFEVIQETSIVIFDKLSVFSTSFLQGGTPCSSFECPV